MTSFARFCCSLEVAIVCFPFDYSSNQPIVRSFMQVNQSQRWVATKIKIVFVLKTKLDRLIELWSEPRLLAEWLDGWLVGWLVCLGGWIQTFLLSVFLFCHGHGNQVNQINKDALAANHSDITYFVSKPTLFTCVLKLKQGRLVFSCSRNSARHIGRWDSIDTNSSWSKVLFFSFRQVFIHSLVSKLFFLRDLIKFGLCQHFVVN